MFDDFWFCWQQCKYVFAFVVVEVAAEVLRRLAKLRRRVSNAVK